MASSMATRMAWLYFGQEHSGEWLGSLKDLGLLHGHGSCSRRGTAGRGCCSCRPPAWLGEGMKLLPKVYILARGHTMPRAIGAPAQLHPGQVCLRLLRHRHGVPPGQNVHSRLRLHSLSQPRRRPALPRHEQHPLASSTTTACMEAASRGADQASLRLPSSSPASRASFPPPSPATPSGWPSTRP